jgi:hypothetical protein
VTTVKERVRELIAGAPIKDAEVGALGGRATRPLAELFTEVEGPDADWRRRQIVHALGVVGSRRAVELLLEIATDPAQPLFLREEAARELGATGAPKAIRFLIERLEQSGDELERKSAVLGLARSDRADARAALERAAADDPSEAVRQAAADALGRVEHRPEDYHEGEY